MDWTARVGRHVKLRQLHVLLAVAEAGSMGRAAAVLAVSQPVVSKSIADLEQAVGQRLLDRSKLGVTPTIYGRALLDCGLAVFDELRQGMQTLAHLADPATGETRIGCTEPAAMGFVPAVIDRLSRRYPRLVVGVVTGDPSALIQRELRERRVEVIVGAVPFSGEVPDDVNVEMLFEDLQVVMAGARNRWLRKRGIALADLVNEPWILPPMDSGSGKGIAGAFRAAGLEPPKSAVVAYSIPLCERLLATGRFLAVLPATMARLSAHTSLRLVDVKWPRLPRGVAAMTLKDRSLSPSARFLIEAARETAVEWMAKVGPAAGAARTPGTVRRKSVGALPRRKR